MKDRLFEVKDGHTRYHVPVQNRPITGTIAVPGSKSITSRALLMAALSQGRTSLTGVLFSDDSRHFLSCLTTLGFEAEVNESEKVVTIIGVGGSIPKKETAIDVGSAGTAARFLTAMLALSDGTYIINCSEQMKKRPMKPLFDALADMGAVFDYLETEHHLPVRVTGNGGKCKDISLDITKSTQFLSALLMMGPMIRLGMTIHIIGEKVDGAYISVTRAMLEQFGAAVTLDGSDYHIPAGSTFQCPVYAVEPDVSAACYFYAMSALTGGDITVKGVRMNLMQGDIKFLDVLKQLGCKIIETEEGVRVIGPAWGSYEGIDVNMNDFSDQTMTLAALAPFASSSTVIRGVSHIRLQECDRMQGIVNELSRVGVNCRADGTNIFIQPGKPHSAIIETYDDHRFAMAFTLMGLKAEGIMINDPLCCRKTFENYFEVLDELLS
ncbi:MAG: 3-phosphoshikimate 1-carboxyvinyltransferase [Eubacteriales bacterium]